MQVHTRLGATALVLASLCLTVPAGAEAPLNAAAIMQRIDARNPALRTFEAPVHVDVRMLSFPWLTPKLDGTSYFKRPDRYEVVFDRVPSYAHGVNKLFGDVADPAAWQRDSDVVFDGVENVDERPLLRLRMTKKIYSDQLRDAVAYIDPATYQVVRMEYNYRSGGTIVMSQTYKNQGPYSVIATQHADIRIPRVHAVADATFGVYQTNVAVDDSVFAKR